MREWIGDVSILTIEEVPQPNNQLFCLFWAVECWWASPPIWGIALFVGVNYFHFFNICFSCRFDIKYNLHILYKMSSNSCFVFFVFKSTTGGFPCRTVGWKVVSWADKELFANPVQRKLPLKWFHEVQDFCSCSFLEIWIDFIFALSDAPHRIAKEDSIAGNVYSVMIVLGWQHFLDRFHEKLFCTFGTFPRSWHNSTDFPTLKRQ